MEKLTACLPGEAHCLLPAQQQLTPRRLSCPGPPISLLCFRSLITACLLPGAFLLEGLGDTSACFNPIPEIRSKPGLQLHE